MKEDRALLADFRATEKQEYDYFSMLSFALRESHEKERAQAEKTKYWSIIGSIAGTLIGAHVENQSKTTKNQWMKLMERSNAKFSFEAKVLQAYVLRYPLQER